MKIDAYRDDLNLIHIDSNRANSLPHGLADGRHGTGIVQDTSLDPGREFTVQTVKIAAMRGAQKRSKFKWKI